MKETFLLKEVMDDLVDTEKSLSGPLTKLNYFAKLIKNQDLINYTECEINGYREKSQFIPPYRKWPGTLYIDMQANVHHHSRELPISMIDESYRDTLQYVYVTEGIAAIEKYAKDLENGRGNDHIVKKLPMETLHVFQEPARKLYKTDVQIDVIGARLVANSSIVVEIPSAIRTKLIDFVMAIGETFGDNIEIETFKQEETNNQTIIHQMNHTINNSGDGNVINTGDKNQVNNTGDVYKGDLNRLKDELRKYSLEEKDIEEISEIIKNEEPNYENNRLGEQANNWISKITNKSLNGVGKIANSVSANMLATFIKEFYGMI